VLVAVGAVTVFGHNGRCARVADKSVPNAHCRAISRSLQADHSAYASIVETARRRGANSDVILAARRASGFAAQVKTARRDAMLFSFGANAAHGLPRTNDDKRRRVSHMRAPPVVRRRGECMKIVADATMKGRR
jgi:hypothetical protein